MPIVDIQRRFRELGRIRLGHQVETGGVYEKGPRKGQRKTRPVKLPRFRLTSPWKHLVDEAAGCFGGEVKPWDNDGSAEWEVFTEKVDDGGVAYLPIAIPPGVILDQWYELWQGGGLMRRCDGQRQVLLDRKCSCPADPIERQAEAADGKACKPTTRLRVMIPDISDVGIWRLETHGFHAAAELGGVAGLVEVATRQGALIPADLRLVEREGSRRPGQVRKKFYVPAISFRGTLGPVLDRLGILEAGSDMPVLLGVEGRPPLDAGGQAALPAAGTAFDPAPTEESSFPGGRPDTPPPPPPAPDPDPPAPEPAGGFAPPIDANADEVETPEPEPFVPPAHDPDAETGGRTMTGPQMIAMRLAEKGIEDRDVRLRVIGSIIGRTVESSKDLVPREIRSVLAAIDEGTFEVPESEIEVPVPGDDVGGDPGAGAGEGETAAELVPPQPPTSPPPSSSEEPTGSEEFWNGDAWRAYIKARGVTVTEALQEAKGLAEEMEGATVPTSLDQIRGNPTLAGVLRGFVDEVALKKKERR